MNNTPPKGLLLGVLLFGRTQRRIILFIVYIEHYTFAVFFALIVNIAEYITYLTNYTHDEYNTDRKYCYKNRIEYFFHFF